jgi:hypothetical protein
MVELGVLVFMYSHDCPPGSRWIYDGVRWVMPFRDQAGVSARASLAVQAPYVEV